MKNQILKLLESDARLTPQQICVMLNVSLDEVKSAIADFEANGTILGYKTVVDWEKTEKESVSAMIDVKLTPQRGRG